MSSKKPMRAVRLAAPLSFLIYVLPVPNIALHGHTWGLALWRMVSLESGGQANLAILGLAMAIHLFSYLLWLTFLMTPGAWKILFVPAGFVFATLGTIQLHQCTTQVWWPDWLLSGREEPEILDWPRRCSIPNAYLVAGSDVTAEAFDIYLTDERRTAIADIADCGIVSKGEISHSTTGGETVSWELEYMCDSYGCAFTEPTNNWRGMTHSGQPFPIFPLISMHDLGRTWESERITVWLSRPGVVGRYPVEVLWRLPGRESQSALLPPERDVAWWSLSSGSGYIALSVTNRRFRETARDFVAVYETSTGREVFRKYTPALTKTEVQFLGENRFALTDLVNGVPAVIVYDIPRP